ncbi:unnamed protein product [Rhizophagus irregularis]|nr:unnamed protein product [Rhizophagus irregularis]
MHIQRVESKLSNEYGLGLYSREVLAKAILDLPVSKEEKINFDDKLTSYQDLSSMGFINLMQLQKNFIFGSLICGQVYLFWAFPADEVFFLNTSKFVDYDIAIGKDNVSDTKDTKDNADDTKDDEMDIDDDEMETNDGEMDIDDDKMDTDDKMDYKTFDSYTKLDQSLMIDYVCALQMKKRYAINQAVFNKEHVTKAMKHTKKKKLSSTIRQMRKRNL